MNARSIGWLLCAVALGNGCFSTTKIYSKPMGATVVMDGKHPLGATPIELEEQVWLWTQHLLTVEAPGYTTRTVQLRAAGINYGYLVVCVCTLGLLVPLAVTSAYPKQYVVVLTPSTPAPATAALPSTGRVSFR